jgi:hypothetical protein
MLIKVADEQIKATESERIRVNLVGSLKLSEEQLKTVAWNRKVNERLAFISIFKWMLVLSFVTGLFIPPLLLLVPLAILGMVLTSLSLKSMSTHEKKESLK